MRIKRIDHNGFDYIVLNIGKRRKIGYIHFIIVERSLVNQIAKRLKFARAVGIILLNILNVIVIDSDNIFGLVGNTFGKSVHGALHTLYGYITVAYLRDYRINIIGKIRASAHLAKAKQFVLALFYYLTQQHYLRLLVQKSFLVLQQFVGKPRKRRHFNIKSSFYIQMLESGFLIRKRKSVGYEKYMFFAHSQFTFEFVKYWI